MRLVSFVLKAAIVVGAALIVYSRVHDFVWIGLGLSRAYLGWFAAMLLAGTIAAMVGLALTGALSRWNP